MTPPVTDRYAAFVADTDHSAISAKTLEHAKLHILDTIGAALAARSTPVAAIALEHCQATGGPAEATIWGTKLKTGVAMTAFTNGLLAHALDFDDWDTAAHVGHPSCMVVAAALSLGEKLAVSGREFLTAYVLGIEIAARIAWGSAELRERGFHSTPVFGGMGAAAACARVARLTREQTKAAFGVAASGAGGIHRQQGSMVKPFHAGNAARNGIEAVLLAKRGFTADTAIFESPQGFCETFAGAGGCDFDKMISRLGDPFYLESPGLGLKLYPCSAPQFLAADAALEVVRKHRVDYDDVAKIQVSIPPERYQRHYHPEVRTGLKGKFAINYVVALCVLDGRLERASFTDAKANEARTQEALKKVEVIVDEKIPEPGPYCPVTIELKNGAKPSHTATVAKGHPENPLTEAEVLSKFRDNAREAIAAPQCEELIEHVRRLEALTSVRELTALLVPRWRSAPLTVL